MRQGRAERAGGRGNPDCSHRPHDCWGNRLTFAELPEVAQAAVKQALAAGATDVECTISEGDEFSANVRMGELETLKEAGSRGVGLRVLIGKRMGGSYTS